MTDLVSSDAATEQERITAYLQAHWADAVTDPNRTPLTIYQVLAVGAVLAPMVADLRADRERLQAELDRAYRGWLQTLLNERQDWMEFATALTKLVHEMAGTGPRA
jgi:hypothetical protein